MVALSAEISDREPKEMYIAMPEFWLELLITYHNYDLLISGIPWSTATHDYAQLTKHASACSHEKCQKR